MALNLTNITSFINNLPRSISRLDNTQARNCMGYSLEEEISDGELKKRFRELSREFHPDRPGQDGFAQSMIGMAKDVLTNEIENKKNLQPSNFTYNQQNQQNYQQQEPRPDSPNGFNPNRFKFQKGREFGGESVPKFESRFSQPQNSFFNNQRPSAAPRASSFNFFGQAQNSSFASNFNSRQEEILSALSGISRTLNNFFSSKFGSRNNLPPAMPVNDQKRSGIIFLGVQKDGVIYLQQAFNVQIFPRKEPEKYDAFLSRANPKLEEFCKANNLNMPQNFFASNKTR